MPKIRLIAAIDNKNGISKSGKLPWDLPSDRRYFRQQVEAGPVVMGWNTFASNNFKPFGIGDNIVVTRRDIEAAPGVWIVHDAKEFFKKNKRDIWVVGGGQIFTAALPYATELYITRVNGDFNCDTFFPGFEHKFKMLDQSSKQSENDIEFKFETWVKA